MEENVITNDTVYDRKQLEKFQRFHLNKNKLLWISIIILNVFFLYVFIFMTVEEKSLDIKMLITEIFIVLITVYFILIPKIVTSKANLRITNLKYEFGNESFSVTASSDSISENGEIRYEAIYRAYESNSAYYLYISKNQAHIVDKSGFENKNNEEQFKKYLIENLDSKKLHLKK